ncbi:MAG: molybdate ABC transporter permease subunit [Verrucomicrobia bacterium]|nr:molybdate ABC transporter permease subunit [Verrucomicrobiota bacterium]
MSAETWQLVAFTTRMAAFSTLLVIPIGVACAWGLARSRSRAKVLLETLVTLPLVLPPVVTGLVLLKLFGRRGPIGHWLHDQWHLDVVFTWRAVVIALVVMSLPLFVRAAQTAFEEINPQLENMARTLGASEWRVFLTVTLPLARRGVLAGALLAFARALGEFGATMMVAGNIPGQTTTMAVSIYQSVQLGQDAHAWGLAGIAAALAFGAVWASGLLLRRQRP